jgi:hypothetical protein
MEKAAATLSSDLLLQSLCRLGLSLSRRSEAKADSTTATMLTQVPERGGARSASRGKQRTSFVFETPAPFPFASFGYFAVQSLSPSFWQLFPHSPKTIFVIAPLKNRHFLPNPIPASPFAAVYDRRQY